MDTNTTVSSCLFGFVSIKQVASLAVKIEDFSCLSGRIDTCNWKKSLEALEMRRQLSWVESVVSPKNVESHFVDFFCLSLRVVFGPSRWLSIEHDRDYRFLHRLESDWTHKFSSRSTVMLRNAGARRGSLSCIHLRTREIFLFNQIRSISEPKGERNYLKWARIYEPRACKSREKLASKLLSVRD